MQFLCWLEAQYIFDCPFHTIKLSSISEGHLRLHDFTLAYLTMIFAPKQVNYREIIYKNKWGSCKNTVCSIHCLGNNDRFKQLLLENISSAKISDANVWSSSVKLQDTITLFYQGCRQAYFNPYLEQTEAFRAGTDQKKFEYIQPYIFTFFQKSQFLSHKWFDVLWVLNKARKTAGPVSVLISNPIKASNQFHLSCSTVCLYHKLFLTGVLTCRFAVF